MPPPRHHTPSHLSQSHHAPSGSVSTHQPQQHPASSVGLSGHAAASAPLTHPAMVPAIAAAAGGDVVALANLTSLTAHDGGMVAAGMCPGAMGMWMNGPAMPVGSQYAHHGGSGNLGAHQGGAAGG